MQRVELSRSAWYSTKHTRGIGKGNPPWSPPLGPIRPRGPSRAPLSAPPLSRGTRPAGESGSRPSAARGAPASSGRARRGPGRQRSAAAAERASGRPGPVGLPRGICGWVRYVLVRVHRLSRREGKRKEERVSVSCRYRRGGASRPRRRLRPGRRPRRHPRMAGAVPAWPPRPAIRTACAPGPRPPSTPSSSSSP